MNEDRPRFYYRSMSGDSPSRNTVRATDAGRPVVTLLDLLGRRWALRVLWELRRPAQTFRELQDRCDGMSSSVLSTRLSELRSAGVLTPRSEDGYALSNEGERLLQALQPLDDWAECWARRKHAP
jgi:DNA-binding HxlR family transcriptional regulator